MRLNSLQGERRPGHGRGRTLPSLVSDGRSVRRGASSLHLYYFELLYMAWPDSRARSVIKRLRRCPAPLQNFPLLWLRRHPSNCLCSRAGPLRPPGGRSARDVGGAAFRVGSKSPGAPPTALVSFHYIEYLWYYLL